MAHVLSGRAEQHMSDKTQRLATSFAEEICTNGEWTMPKHIIMSLPGRNLTGSAELIMMLNRYGHGQSYTQTLELETAMCNAVTSAESLLPPNISTDINVVLHIHVCLHE